MNVNIDSNILKELESFTEEELINLIKAHKEYITLLENETDKMEEIDGSMEKTP